MQKAAILGSLPCRPTGAVLKKLNLGVESHALTSVDRPMPRALQHAFASSRLLPPIRSKRSPCSPPRSLDCRRHFPKEGVSRSAERPALSRTPQLLVGLAPSHRMRASNHRRAVAGPSRGCGDRSGRSIRHSPVLKSKYRETNFSFSPDPTQIRALVNVVGVAGSQLKS